MSILGDADAFFRRRRRNPSHVGPVVVVGTITGLAFVQHALIEIAVANQMRTGSNEFLFGPYGLVTHLYVLGRPFVIWTLYATAFHVLSGIFGGEGSFRRTFLLPGWGFLPRIPVEFLSVVATWTVVEHVPEPELYATYEYLMQIQTHPLLSVPTAIGLVVTVWALPDLLWVYAVMHARNVERWKAVIAVNIPVGVAVLLTANDLLGSL
jgi:hypothetical protein